METQVSNLFQVYKINIKSTKRSLGVVDHPGSLNRV